MTPSPPSGSSPSPQEGSPGPVGGTGEGGAADARSDAGLRTSFTATLLVALAALAAVGWQAPSALLGRTGVWNDSTGWIVPTLVVGLAALAWDAYRGRWTTPASDDSGTTARVEHIVSQRPQR